MNPLTQTERSIPLSHPEITDADIRSVVSVLKTPRLSLGPKLREFEEKVASYTGARFAVAVNSGTSGLHLAVKSLGIGGHDAVITSPFSFIASANCILYENALPVFMDIEPRTFNLDTEKIEEYLRERCVRDRTTGFPIDPATGRHVRAILPVHVFGHPCNMGRIMELAEEFGLAVIEDACEALGAEYHGRKAGSMGTIGVFAFYPNKQMTTGEGGIIVTDDDVVASLCGSFRNQGRDINGGWLEHARIGYNYRLSDINCALGISQLERIDQILRKREEVAAHYGRLLGDLVATPRTLGGSKRSWFVYVVCLPEGAGRLRRDDVLNCLSRKGIGCNNYFPPIHLQPFYRDRFGYKEGDFPVTEDVAQRTIALPFHNNLGGDDIEYVAEALRGIVNGKA